MITIVSQHKVTISRISLLSLSLLAVMVCLSAILSLTVAVFVGVIIARALDAMAFQTQGETEIAADMVFVG